ncbi:MAG: PD40 domain-containing protein [Gemmatimonadetes bacterium]|nr:PD40 domain-containing protein [Gemmatimonadota bacterium]
MKDSYTAAVAAAALSITLLVTPSRAQAQAQQTDEERAARARAIAQAIEENARQLTVFDRQGTITDTIAERAIYNQPVFSPDRTRLAVIKIDLEKETSNLWVLEIATGRGVQITSSEPREPVAAPVWSPDGSQIAYVALRGSYFGIYRRPSTGAGNDTLLYQHPGGTFVLTDWSLDGRFLSFSSSDLSGGILYVLPVDGDGQVIEIARSASTILAPRLSPDGRFLAYRSNETGRNEIFVRSVAPAGGAATGPARKWQVSTEGGLGMVFWRRDGKELYYFGADRGVMAVQVDTDQDFEFGPPRLLFKAPDAIPVTGTPGGLANVSRDGERVVFAVPPAPQLRQLTVFDRDGKVVGRVGAPGLYTQPALSPDGSRAAVMRQDPQTGNVDIWTFDLSTGKALPVTSDAAPEAAPIWSPDGARVAYVSTRGNYSAIYRKAWNGEGAEEMLFRYTPGAGLALTDFSADGRFLTFDGGGVVLVVPLAGSDPLAREAVDFGREEYEVGLGRFSPDSRFLAYGSNETRRFEVYVRPFDAASGAAAGGEKWQVSREGAIGGIFWRRDGREMYYLSADTEVNEVKVMAVEVTTTPRFEAGTPRELFRLPGPLPGNPAQWKNVSPDGQRFVFAMPASPAAASR